MARLAQSLIVLRQEVNALAPGRSKASDGWIGDPAHASRASRHNPNPEDVVTALDVTHDPANGVDIHWIARLIAAELRAGTWTGNPDLEYMISNGQTCSRSNGWVWVRYGGDNPHTKHCHFAVGRGPDKAPRPPYDDTIPWGIAALLNKTPGTTPAPTPQEDDDMKPVIIKGTTTGHWWATDGVTKRWVPTAGHAKYGHINGFFANPEPRIVEQAFVDELPTTVTEAHVTSIISNLVAEGRANTKALYDAILAINAVEPLNTAQIQLLADKVAAQMKQIDRLSDADKKAIAELTVDTFKVRL